MGECEHRCDINILDSSYTDIVGDELVAYLSRCTAAVVFLLEVTGLSAWVTRTSWLFQNRLVGTSNPNRLTIGATGRK